MEGGGFGPEAVLLGGSLENDHYDIGESRGEQNAVSPFNDNVKHESHEVHNLRAVDRLWSYCESSTASVKLILPDALTTPYYLPTPRGPKNKSEKEVAREQARLNFLVKREVSGRISKLGSNSVKGILPSLTSGSSISRKENAMIEKILNAYRKDGDRRQELQDSIDERIKAKRQRFNEMIKKREERQRCPSPGSVKDKIVAAAERRTAIVEQEKLLFSSKREEWQDKIEIRKMEAHLMEKFPQRQMEWLVIVLMLKRLQHMANDVMSIREYKQGDIRRWNALLLIQRAMRRYRIKKYGLKGAYPSRFKGISVGHEHKTIFMQRQDACTVITRFLYVVSGGWKSIIGSYVRKVKLIQRRVRAHLTENQNRHYFVSYYLDKIFPAILSHAQVVMNDKGHDLDNMTALDISRIRFQLRGYKTFHMVTEMDSAGYHAFLRKHQKLIKGMSRFFGPSARSYPNINLELIKRKVILDLVFRKRWEYVTRLDSFQPVSYHTPSFSIDDVKQFIEGGTDPLEKYLTDMKELQDQRYSEYMEKLKASKTGRVHRVYSRSETMLLLLNAIKPEDATAVYLRVTEIAFQHLTQMRPTTSATVKSSFSSNSDAYDESGQSNNGDDENGAPFFYDEENLGRAGSNADGSSVPIRTAMGIKGTEKQVVPIPPKLSSVSAPRRGSVMPQQSIQGIPENSIQRSLVASGKDEGELRPSQPTDSRKKSMMLMSPRVNKIK